MWEFLNRLDVGAVVFLTLMLPVVLTLCLGVPIGIILDTRRKARLKEQEHALIQEMLVRGMSAEEIERVIQATGGGAAANAVQTAAAVALAKVAAAEAAGPKGPGFDKARLIQVLAEHGMEAGDIEQVLCVLGEYADDELPAKVAAVQSMVENGMEAGDIQRVIRAFHRSSSPAEPRPSAFRE